MKLNDEGGIDIYIAAEKPQDVPEEKRKKGTIYDETRQRNNHTSADFSWFFLSERMNSVNCS